jgi:hypothetical protein
VRQGKLEYSPPAVCNLAAALAEGLAVSSPRANLSKLIDHCPNGPKWSDRDKRQTDVRRQAALQVLLAKKVPGLHAHAAANDFRPLSQDQIEDALFEAKNEDDLKKKVREFLPDIVLLERGLSPEQIALISRNDSWAARLTRNYVDPIALLSRLVFELDATQLSNALLDLLARQSASWKEPSQADVGSLIQLFVACGRQDQARQLFLKYVEYFNSQKSAVEEERLTALSMLIVAASRLADDRSAARFADELLHEAIKEPTSKTIIGISAAVASLWLVDPARAKALLANIMDNTLLLGDDTIRNNVTGVLAGDLTQTPAIRRARLTALQIGDTDGALKALLGIVRHADQTNSLDFHELGSAASLVQRITEEDSGGDL